MSKKASVLQKCLQIMPIIGLLFFFVLILYAYHHGIFRSSTSLQAFIQEFGKYAVIVFVLLQVIQVIIPILPGGISSVAGMLMFGNGFGLLYSCIGLVIGEAIGFLLVRYYGVAFVQLILSP
ncbi:MAG: TVP38/TMEM64 family protein, partial [Enterococcus faecium]|nr:TVP38/TMEM64 family protein [Enterococcus faecium]